MKKVLSFIIVFLLSSPVFCAWMNKTQWGTTKPPPGSTINWNDTLTNGLVGAYILAEKGGPKTVNSAKPSDPSIGIVNGTPWTFGPNGSAFLGGAANYIDIGSALAVKPVSLNCPNQMTIISLVNPNQVTNQGVIVADENGSDTLEQYSFGIITGNIRVRWAGTNFTPSGTVVANIWQTLGFTRTGSAGAWTVNGYINGEPVGTVATITNPSAQQGAKIGTRGAVGIQSWTGSIAYIYIWNRALSASEIKQISNNPYSIFASPKQYFIHTTSTPNSISTTNIFYHANLFKVNIQ